MALKISLPTEFTQFHTLLAISTPLKDYRLVHAINENLLLSLKRIDDFPYYVSEDKGFEHYPMFHGEDEFYRTNYFLFTNKIDGGILVPQWARMDYLFLFEGDVSSEQVNNITQKIRRINNVLMVSTVELAKVKNIELIFSDLEMHMTELNRKAKEQRNELRYKAPVFSNQN